MLNDKQQFILRIGQGMLGGQNRIQRQIIAIRHLIGKIGFGPFGAGVIGLVHRAAGIFGFIAHVTAFLLWNSGLSQARVSMISARILTAPSTSLLSI